MKNKLFKSKTLLSLNLLVILLLASCATSSIPMEILIPAEINIKKDIKHLGIINRSLPARRKKIVNILEGFISGESILADRIGSEYCLKGLAEKLNNSPRFSAVVIEGENLRGTGTRRFPVPLNWDRVKRICEKYRVDALIALETFDSNVHIDVDKRSVTKKVKTKDKKVKKKIKVIRYYSDLYIDVNSGWKVYDPVSERIIDVNVFRDRKRWDTKGDTRKDALRRLPSKREAINIAGYNSGVQYGIRISPTWININREFYIKGNPALVDAKKYVRAKDWENAIRIWKKLLSESDKKTAGRAAYNLAFAAEIRGEFDKAYKWAKESYTKYGNKKAYGYMNMIRDRITDKYILEKQME
ncbi:MAG: DUF6340 family protein [Acidobacteriota bacterium]